MFWIYISYSIEETLELIDFNSDSEENLVVSQQYGIGKLTPKTEQSMEVLDGDIPRSTMDKVEFSNQSLCMDVNSFVPPMDSDETLKPFDMLPNKGNSFKSMNSKKSKTKIIRPKKL